MRSFTSSDRLYLENLARDVNDTDSVYGLARNRSLTGDERGMADLLDLYLRLAPCGEQADRARDILWGLPREGRGKRRMRRAQVLCDQAGDHIAHPRRCLEIARRSWKRGKTPGAAQLMAQSSLRLDRPGPALRYALAACRLDPKDLNARLLLASVLQKRGMAHACRSALRQAAALCGGAEDSSVFCQAALAVNQGDLAVERAEGLLASAPESVDALLLLAMTLRAAGREEGRVRQLLSQIAVLDAEHPASGLLQSGEKSGLTVPQLQTLRALRALEKALTQETDGEMDAQLRQQILVLLNSPSQDLAALGLSLLVSRQDALGLRMALLESELSPMQYALVLHALEEMGEPLPCFARVEGRLCLLPQPPRPPYDEDL
ncbi:MAG: hypothetical protein IJS53_05900, partial [Clostridia bacterium]|nr:hypothetical protein [Clostridia bacterium]